VAKARSTVRPASSRAAVLGVAVLLFGPVVAPFTAVDLASASAADLGVGQNFTAESNSGVSAERAGWAAVVSRSVATSAEVRASQDFARIQLDAAGFGPEQFTCLVDLWNRESRWNHRAENSSSGAYGIPQSLPGKKMASAGADWETNPETQIRWGLGYISSRYGSPCDAWAHSEAKGWY
jgi:hypothetical protein